MSTKTADKDEKKTEQNAEQSTDNKQDSAKSSKSKSNSGDKKKSGYDKDTVLKWYEEMLLQRRFEERAGMLYGQSKIDGFCHLYIGQEAVSTGIEAAMRDDDYMITAYRDHGQALVRGISPDAVMAELMGREDGVVGGKGGSMHMFSKEHSMYGGHGIVGAQIPIGAGLAFAAKYRGEDKVCVTMFGDGAARQGALHETFNMAMLWNLPVVFVVENNKYAMGTSIERTSNVTDIYKLGQAYEMPSEQVDGMSVFEVYEAASEAINAAREGNGPTFLEIRTYRYKGHSMSDPAKYRTKDELNEYKDRDPIVQLKSYILDQELTSQDELDKIDDKVKARVKEAVEFAENSPVPDGKKLYENVYVDDYPFLKDF
ncbi:MAG: pyruvate dehydrogenase (acetyl-transferring) E1 component subunit alpha [Bacteroidota bacterium]